MVTVSVDEKPSLQAIANTAPDLPPRPGRHRTIGRDHEYKRLGTASILAALNLHDGHITARVERKHRSREFILLLKDLDAYYPPGVTIRVILDNHSAHLSKETRAYLETQPTGLSMSLHLSTAPGSTWSKHYLARWPGPFLRPSGSNPGANCANAF